MNYPPGKIMLLDEFENNPDRLIGEYFRVVGKYVFPLPKKERVLRDFYTFLLSFSE